MTGRWSSREAGAGIVWLAALVAYAISLNTTWFILDGREFDVPRNISSMRPLIGAGTVGSATFVFYLFATILLFGLAANAIRDRTHRTGWRVTAVAVAAAVEIVLALMKAGGPVLGRRHAGDIVPQSVTDNIWFGIAAVMLLVVAALLPEAAEPARRILRKRWPAGVALVAAIIAYGVAVRVPWLEAAGAGTFHIGSSLFGAAYLIAGLIMIGLAAAAWATGASAIRTFALVFGLIWASVLVVVIVRPLVFVFDPAPAVDVAFMRAGDASVAFDAARRTAGPVLALAAILLALAATRPMIRRPAWHVYAVLLTLVATLSLPWVTLRTGSHTAQMGLLTGVAAFAGGAAVAQLIALPVLAGLSVLGCRWPVTALAGGLLAIDVAIAVRPQRFVALTFVTEPIHGTPGWGLYAAMALAVFALAGVWAGRPSPGHLAIRHLAVVIAGVAGLVALFTTWAVGDVQGLGHYAGTVYSAPQGLAILLAMLLLLAGGRTMAGSGIAFLVVAAELLLRPAWLLPEQYAVTLAQFDNYEHVVTGFGLIALPVLIVSAATFGVGRPAASRDHVGE